jgi:hypothetical protein
MWLGVSDSGYGPVATVRNLYGVCLMALPLARAKCGNISIGIHHEHAGTHLFSMMHVFYVLESQIWRLCET